MLEPNPGHSATNPVVSKPRTEIGLLLPFDFYCGSEEEVDSGLKEFGRKVEFTLNSAQMLETRPLKVSRIEMSKGRTRKGRTKVTLEAYFELETRSKAHYFFSAEATHITFPDTRTLIGIMEHGSGVVLDSMARAANSRASSFKEADHGHVKFFDTFETEIMFENNRIYYYMFSFASAEAPFQSGSHRDLREALRRS